MSKREKANPLPPTISGLLWPYVFRGLNETIKGYGGRIAFEDLSRRYPEETSALDLRAKHFTGLSDGKDILLHPDLPKVGSPVYWAWDALHLFGHTLQWHMSPRQAQDRGLKFYGKAAQKMAVRNFMGANEASIREMQTYELEANSLALSLAMHEICATPGAPKLTKKQIQVFFDDMKVYAAQDIVGLTKIYNPHLPSEYYSEEKALEALRPVSPPEVTFSKLPRVCVPVVH